MFPMAFNGIVEVLVYMETNSSSHSQIIVLANQYESSGHHPNRGAVGLTSGAEDYVNGWHTLSMAISGLGTSMGYISIMGMKSPNSTVLIDSFRYIPPGMDASECQLYEDLPGVDDD
ncbi:hypothetical protein PYW07_002905 [Mythimna separata]|uniref:Uncharacterized protein n=1 Tax=Mythimna separata TaxID=271217 RepID=A0AAD7YG58_MYTSE|nr:hypothetical protein PYW07_002905 [Mythimna separata]